jgi:hypothetical protein
MPPPYAPSTASEADSGEEPSPSPDQNVMKSNASYRKTFRGARSRYELHVNMAVGKNNTAGLDSKDAAKNTRDSEAPF